MTLCDCGGDVSVTDRASDSLPPQYASAVRSFVRPPPKGVQYFTKVQDGRVVGAPDRHMAADLQVPFFPSPCPPFPPSSPVQSLPTPLYTSIHSCLLGECIGQCGWGRLGTMSLQEATHLSEQIEIKLEWLLAQVAGAALWTCCCKCGLKGSWRYLAARR